MFKAFAIQTLSECTSFVQDLKLGHYIKVPPRATFIGMFYSLPVRLFVCLLGLVSFCILGVFVAAAVAALDFIVPRVFAPSYFPVSSLLLSFFPPFPDVSR